MDVDQPDAQPSARAAAGDEHKAHHSHHVNAEAGPSSLPDTPAVFLPPSGSSRARPMFSATEDLITRFQLLPAYDKYVRPYIHLPSASAPAPDGPLPSSASSSAFPSLPAAKTTAGATPGASVATPGFVPPTPGGVDKGKGRQMSVAVGTPRTPYAAPTPAGGDGDGEDGEDDGGGAGTGAAGERKLKNNYRHLIKGIPGKHSTRKDDYLYTMMMVPPKQKMKIAEFDERTRHEAFTVSAEGLKGWNINALVAESAQAREDRKKRKELKKLAKSQQMSTLSQPLSAGPTSAPSLPLHGLSTTVPSTTAPTPGPRRAQTPLSAGVGTPGALPVPAQRSASRPPGTGPGPGGGPHQVAPGRAASAVPGVGAAQVRGKKREHEDDGGGTGAPGLRRGVSAAPVGAKASLAVGAGQRPVKKQRTETTPHSMGLPGLPRDVAPQQQPTPQGV